MIEHIVQGNYAQWLNYSKVGGGTLHFRPSLSHLPSPPFHHHPSLSFHFLPPPISFPSLSLPSLLLEVGPLNPARGLGERCKLSHNSEFWGRAPAKIEFGAFKH